MPIVCRRTTPDSDQVRAFRQAADGKYEQAAKILDRATEVSDIQRAQGLLQGAQSDVQQSRRYLDRATGGTGNIPGDDAVRPQPLPENERQVQAVPQNQRGVSFFSSQPAPLGSLVPVTITVNGESRQVLATPEEAEELRQGRMPQVRSFNVNGQYVPWYEYSSYDPYRDYWQYQNAGWGGFGGGVVAGLVGAELLGDLFAPRGYGYGGFGYGGYGYSTPFAFSPDKTTITVGITTANSRTWRRPAVSGARAMAFPGMTTVEVRLSWGAVGRAMTRRTTTMPAVRRS